MRRSCLLLLATMLALAAVPFPQPPASASCAGPRLKEPENLSLQRGAMVTIEGRGFVEGCSDSMGCTVGVGCDDCEYDSPPEVPMEDVGLRLVQRGRSWHLAVADAGTAEDNELGWVTWTFEVPDGVRPGRARLVPDSAEPVAVLIR